MIHRVVTFLRSLKVELFEVRGTSRATVKEICLACCAREKTLIYIADVVLHPGYTTVSRGSVWLWRVSYVAKRLVPDAVLFFLEVGVENKKLHILDRRLFRIPVWVRGEIHLPLERDITAKKDFKEQTRKIRKAGFSYEVASSTEQYVDFYDNMYVPQVSESHGESTVLYNRESIVEPSKEKELLLIKKDDQVVAGEFIIHEAQLSKLHAVGVRNRDADLIREGALAACYYFGLKHLEERGVTVIDVGGSRGFIRDGVLNYKRKWGMRVVNSFNSYLLMRVLSDSADTVSILRDLPTICDDNGELISLVFSTEDEIADQESNEKYIESHFIPGTSGLFACPLIGVVTFDRSRFVRLTCTDRTDR